VAEANEQLVAPRVTHVMLSPTLIADTVAAHYGISRAHLLGRRRLPHIALPRQIAMLLCLEMLHGSLPQVGRWFGRDHTTVLHARDRMRRRIAVDRKFAKQVADLRRIIGKVA
jgi:chromosomal replication initiator protein